MAGGQEDLEVKNCLNRYWTYVDGSTCRYCGEDNQAEFKCLHHKWNLTSYTCEHCGKALIDFVKEKADPITAELLKSLL